MNKTHTILGGKFKKKSKRGWWDAEALSLAEYQIKVGKKLYLAKIFVFIVGLKSSKFLHI